MIMSTIRSYDDALDFFPAAKREPPRFNLLATIRAVWEALGEGLAASRRYHELTARGMSHDQAAAKVFFEHYGR